MKTSGAWSFFRICIVAVFSLGAASAYAQEASDKEMRFVVVRSAEPGCEPVCPEWISAEGEITRRSDDRLRETLRKLGKRRLPIVINSPGGSVEAAMAMGKIIRERKLDVALGRTTFLGCQPAQKDCKLNDGRGASYYGLPQTLGVFCNSACPLVLAGGVHRVADPDTYIGLHQVTTTFTKTKVTYQTRYRIVKGKRRVISKKVVRRENTGSYTTYEMNASMEKQLRRYLEGLGVDPNLVERMKQTSANSIGYLPHVDSNTAKLTERSQRLSALVASSACKSVPASSNCRLITTDDLKG